MLARPFVSTPPLSVHRVFVLRDGLRTALLEFPWFGIFKRVDLRTTVRAILQVRMTLRTLLLTFVAGAVAAILDLAIGTVAPKFTRVPQDFPPFTFLPILSGAVGGTILASVVYSMIRVLTVNPDRIFFFVSLVVFALSLGLPLRLSFTRSHRFAGVTPSAQMVLVLMHAIVLVVSFTVLTARSDP